MAPLPTRTFSRRPHLRVPSRRSRLGLAQRFHILQYVQFPTSRSRNSAFLSMAVISLSPPYLLPRLTINLPSLPSEKERGNRQWRRSCQTPRAATVSRLVAPLTVPSNGTWSARARSLSPVHLPRDSGSPHSLTTAIHSIRQGFRLRLDLRSVHEGSVPRSMHSHLPLLRLIMSGLPIGQSVLL